MDKYTEYELFVQELHQKLIDSGEHGNVEVKHNIKIQGKSGAKHQIDVYWSNSIAGVEQDYCVECKHWDSMVKKSDIASFVGVLNDIGHARGIFVTTKGYQKGAKLLAEENKIILIVANKIVNKYQAQLKVCLPSFEDIELNFKKAEDHTHFLAEMSGSQETDDVKIHDSRGNEFTLTDLIEHFNYEDDGNYQIDLSGNYINTSIGSLELDSVKLLFKNNCIEASTLNGWAECVEAVVDYILANRLRRISL